MSSDQDTRMTGIPGSLSDVFEFRQVALRKPFANCWKIELWATMVMLSAGALIGIGVLIGYGAWGSANDWDALDAVIDSPFLPAPGNTSTSALAPSCAETLRINSSAENGLYNILDTEGSLYRTYCDMRTGGGGWTLVASVHENNLGVTGRCTVGDRWSSQQGLATKSYKAGERSWESTSVFGAPEAVTSDDYKNPGYYNMIAKDIMIWHVPNETPVKNYENEAFMKYYSDNRILESYGGNLKTLYRAYPIKNYMYDKTSGNGPSAPVVWDRGNKLEMVRNTPPRMRVQTTPGYVQFRAINRQQEAFALCPGVKKKDGAWDAEHVCIGGAGSKMSSYCGDFAAKDYSGYATGVGMSSTREMTESVVMIFYR